MVSAGSIIDGKCPEGWAARRNDCFLFKPNHLTTWYSASQTCKMSGGPKATLASVTNTKDNM